MGKNMFSNIKGKYESIDDWMSEKFESIDDWKSGMFVTRSDTQKKQTQQRKRKNMFSNTMGKYESIDDWKSKKYESLDCWKSGMFVTRSDTQKKQLDESANRALVCEHERQPSLSNTVNSDDESACFDLIDDMISDDELSIYTENDTKNATSQCHSVTTRSPDLIDDTSVPIHSDESRNRPSLCNHDRQPSRSHACPSDDESVSINIIDDMISDDELSFVSGNNSNNARSQSDTTSSFNLHDMISDDDLSLDSENETHNSSIHHDDHSNLTLSSITTAKTRNREQSSSNLYAHTSTQPKPSTISKAPIPTFSCIPTSPATAIAPTPRTSFSQKIIDKKKKLRTLEVKYRRQKVEVVNKPVKQKPEIKISVQEKGSNISSDLPSTPTTIVRQGLKQNTSRNAEEIIYLNLMLCFFFFIGVLYKEAFTEILRSK